MKRRLLCALAAMVILAVPSAALAGKDEDEKAGRTIDDGIKSVLDGVDISSLDDIYDSGLFGGRSLDDVIGDISKNGWDAVTEEEALAAVKKLLADALLKGLPFVTEMVAVLLLLGILSRLRSKDGTGITYSAFTAGYVTAAGLAAAMLASAVTTATGSLAALAKIIDVITPVLAGILTAIGSLSGSALLTPTMAALTGAVFTVMRSVVIPVILISAALALASDMSTVIKLKRLTALLESAVKWGLGIIMIVFLGVLAIKGLSGAAIDGITFKTAKYTIDKMVPVIGGMFSDSLDTMMACGLMVKNAVGIVGMILLAGAAAMPAATVAANMFLFRIAAAVSEPFADERCTAMLMSMASAAQLLSVTMLAAAAMAFISLAVFIGAADMSVMLR